MQLDSALNLQSEVFKDVFDYEELPAAFAAGEARFGTPTFIEPEAVELAKESVVLGRATAVHRADEVDADAARELQGVPEARRRDIQQKRDIALGVGFRGAESGKHELVVMYQDRKLKDEPILGRIADTARGEARFTYVGRAKALARDPWHRAHIVDPLRLGSSLSHFKVTAGTLGCCVYDRLTGKEGVLSNNHVLANVNRGNQGDEIRQPGTKDGGRSAQRIASLESYVPMDLGNGVNRLDCAWATFDESGRAINRNEIYDSAGVQVGTLAGMSPIDAWPEVEVVKIGRTTGYTQGVIDAINVNNLVVRYGRRTARFDGQIQIEALARSPFARPGDSGSLILDRDFQPLGLLFSGSGTGGFENMGYTWANPIANVLDSLNLDILI